MVAFLQKRALFEDTKAHQQESLGKNQNSSERKPFAHSRQKYRSQQVYVSSTTKPACSYRQGDHFVAYCEKFKHLSSQEFFEAANQASLCLNCLRDNHRLSECSLSIRCGKCGKKHNILLHFGRRSPIESPSLEPSCPTMSTRKSTTYAVTSVSSEGLLATAIVDLFNPQGKSKPCRVFLDTGSQANFITEDTASFSKLYKREVDISVTSVEHTSTGIKHSVSATMKSRISKYQKNLDFFVLSRIKT